MRKKCEKIVGPRPARYNWAYESRQCTFSPYKGNKVKQSISSPIRLTCRLRQFFTAKRFISMIAAALFGSILRLCILHSFPNLSLSDFSVLLPTSLGSIIVGGITGLYYDHFLGVGELDRNKDFKDIDFSKLFMNNTGSNSNAGTFTNTIAELFNPVEVHCSHGTRTLNYDQLQQLNNQATALGLFTITDINITNKTCTVTFNKPVSELDNIAEADLLKRLYLMFPNGDNYSSTVKQPSVLDEHRLQGCIKNALDKANANPDSVYISDQHKPANMSPRYNPYARPGYYQPWAGDIADSITRYRVGSAGHANNNRIILDRNSTIFLLTFANAHPEMNPSELNTGNINRNLRVL